MKTLTAPSCFVLSACLFAGLSVAQAAEPAKGLSLQPDSRNRDVVAIVGSQRKPLLLWKVASIKGPIQGQSLIADSGPGQERYILLSVDSRSGTGPADGACGKGVETDLIWLALNDKLEVRKNDTYRIASGAAGAWRRTQPQRHRALRRRRCGAGLQVHDRVN
ncbi:MAG: hypothetical protein JF591_22510 [Lysobacter sp.]|nr:hypothetical protein [Lysobacter sp.]